jgi:3-hydroxyacyl-[acyl-carrier-protein] dehydratase
VQQEFAVPLDHPAFAGHFPDFPVLPGALLLDELLQRIGAARALDLTAWQVTSAKFLGSVRPGDALLIEHEAGPDQIRFSIRCAERTVLSGSLSRLPDPA